MCSLNRKRLWQGVWLSCLVCFPLVSLLTIESSLMLGVSEWALKQAHVQEMYSEHSWGSLKRHFPENIVKKSNEAVSGVVQ
jgi:hypothetical protein